MTTNANAKTFTTALLTESVKLAWVLIRLGQQGRESRCPLVVSRLYKRLWLAGEALEAGCDRIAARLGILDAVLERCAG
jgi:hypothetical protein